MIDCRAALEAVVRHAVELEDEHDDIAPTVEALVACGDASLVPRLLEAMDQFLDEENDYGRDLIAGVLAGIAGVAALPVLLRASARDLGDDQDTLYAEITELLHADPAASQPVVREFAPAAADTNPRVRSTAIGGLPDPAGDDRTFDVLVAARRDPDEQVRVTAASKLGDSDRGDAIAPLMAVIDDKAPRVRSMAADALRRLGDD